MAMILCWYSSIVFCLAQEPWLNMVTKAFKKLEEKGSVETKDYEKVALSCVANFLKFLEA